MITQPHLKIKQRQISSFVLLPGDPKRVNLISKKLNKFKVLSFNREFKIGTGYYKNQKITVCSTGIGCASTAIAVEELINAGAKTLIRVGTCGGAWKKNIPLGSLVIPTASIRDEGTSKEYIKDNFPAVADFETVTKLKKSAEKNKAKFFIGINRTHDAFYGNQKAITQWGDYLKDKRWKSYDTPILSSEMESSALFIIASLRQVQAGAIFAVNANPEPLKDRILGKKQTVVTEVDLIKSDKITNKMIKVALDAITENF
jgi:uridine phosphorylase